MTDTLFFNGNILVTLDDKVKNMINAILDGIMKDKD